MDTQQVAVEKNAGRQRWEAGLDGQVGFIDYRLAGDMIIYTHTEVPEALEGKGVAGKLVHAALEDARARHQAVVPMCPFVASYIRCHREYADLVHPDYQSLVARD